MDSGSPNVCVVLLHGEVDKLGRHATLVSGDGLHQILTLSSKDFVGD